MSPQAPIPATPLRLGILLSGGGTTLQNLAEWLAQPANTPLAQIACVISSNHTAYGLTRAAKLGLPSHTIVRKEHPSPESFSAAITATLHQYQVDLVCMAGFLSLWQIPPEFVNPPRVMNIHPALIPNFCGKGMHGHHVHEAVIAARATVSGCTVHFADNQYDHGPIILQKTCPVLPTDTPETLAGRVFAQECLAYPEAITLYATNRLRVENQVVIILPA